MKTADSRIKVFFTFQAEYFITSGIQDKIQVLDQLFKGYNERICIFVSYLLFVYRKHLSTVTISMVLRIVKLFSTEDTVNVSTIFSIVSSSHKDHKNRIFAPTRIPRFCILLLLKNTTKISK